MEKYVFITGGAGFIGTNLCPKLIEKGYHVVIADDFVNSKSCHIKRLQQLYPDKIDVYKFDITDKTHLEKLFEKYNFEGVIHLAAKKYIDESFKHPEEYMQNNVGSTKLLLDTMTKYGVKKLLFASSVSVYGETKYLPVDEAHPLTPLSPYAESKKQCEHVIAPWAKQNTAIVCRFSNPTGADEKLMLGDDSTINKSSLIPYMCRKIKANEELMFNGNCYNTKDGTTIRDYIHITDLTQIVADLFENTTESTTVNVARGGEGVSILDVLHAFENSLGYKLDYGFGPPRQGDIPAITFSTDKLHSTIKVEYKKDMEDIVSSQLAFEDFKQQNQEDVIENI